MGPLHQQQVLQTKHLLQNRYSMVHKACQENFLQHRYYMRWGNSASFFKEYPYFSLSSLLLQCFLLSYTHFHGCTTNFFDGITVSCPFFSLKPPPQGPLPLSKLCHLHQTHSYATAHYFWSSEIFLKSVFWNLSSLKLPLKRFWAKQELCTSSYYFF